MPPKHKLSPNAQPDSKRRRAPPSTARTRSQGNNKPPGVEEYPSDEDVVEALPVTVKEHLIQRRELKSDVGFCFPTSGFAFRRHVLLSDIAFCFPTSGFAFRRPIAAASNAACPVKSFCNRAPAHWMGSFVLAANIGRRELGGVLFGRREFGGALLGAGWASLGFCLFPGDFLWRCVP
jgi:hypothetical protein